MLGTGYREIKQQGYEYKGYVAENYVQQEIAALGIEPSFSWRDARAEIEFIIADDLGRIVPVEVKAVSEPVRNHCNPTSRSASPTRQSNLQVLKALQQQRKSTS